MAKTKRVAEKPEAGPDMKDPKHWPKQMAVIAASLDSVKPYPRNTRTHPPEQIKLLAHLLTQYGPDQPIVVDEDWIILKGHGRMEAAQAAGYKKFPVVVREGLSEADKISIRISDNQVALLAGWDSQLMKVELTTLKQMDYNLSDLGFGRVELVQFETTPGPEGDENRGKLLALVDVTIDDPKSKVERGDHFVLSGKHHLFCESVVDGWRAWSPHLKDSALFCPYPGVFVPFGTKAKNSVLILVQSDPYIAGHILDRWIDVHGKKAVKKVTP